MATESKMVGIKNSWSLSAFARQYKRMQVGDFVNSESGECFKSCIFTDSADNKVFVAFSSKLGELTPKEIAEQKDSLQVLQLESDHYVLCKTGESSWQDVDLGL
jgi:hypothetical protein